MFLLFLCVLSEVDKDLINRIFAENHARLYYISMKMLQNDSDAQDAVAQTFLKIMEHMEKIGSLPDSRIVPYCIVIVKHVSVDILRQKNRIVYTDEIDAAAAGEGNDAESRFFEEADREQLLAAISGLSKEDRYLIHLHYGNGLGYQEIARLLEVSEEAAKKRGQRVLKKLRTLYETADGGRGENGHETRK